MRNKCCNLSLWSMEKANVLEDLDSVTFRSKMSRKKLSLFYVGRMRLNRRGDTPSNATTVLKKGNFGRRCVWADLVLHMPAGNKVGFACGEQPEHQDSHPVLSIAMLQ